MLGYAGVYSSFLLHVYEAARKFDWRRATSSWRLARRKMVGGQEDLIIDVAYDLKNGRSA
jgi:4-hydroxy 2-oxovalerate aldolase